MAHSGFPTVSSRSISSPQAVSAFAAGKFLVSLLMAPAPLSIAFISQGGPRLIGEAIATVGIGLSLTAFYAPRAHVYARVGVIGLLLATVLWVPFGGLAFVVDYWSIVGIGLLSIG